MTGVESIVRQHLVDEFMAGHSDELTADLDLIAADIVDSLGIFVLIDFLQERFGIEITEEDVVLENFETVNAIVALVESRTTNPPPSREDENA